MGVALQMKQTILFIANLVYFYLFIHIALKDRHCAEVWCERRIRRALRSASHGLQSWNVELFFNFIGFSGI